MSAPDPPNRNVWSRALFSARRRVHRLPAGEAVWRVAIALIGLVIVVVGVIPAAIARTRLADHLFGHRCVGHGVCLGKPAAAPVTHICQPVDVMGKHPAAVATISGRHDRLRGVRDCRLALVLAQ
jgi:hypothetical protein